MSEALVSAIAFTPEQAHDLFLQAFKAARKIIANGKGALVEVRYADEPITTKQRRFLKDVVFGQVAEQVWVIPPGVKTDSGERVRYNKAAWAELYRSNFLGDRWENVKLPGQRTKRRKVRNSTEELGHRKYAEYTDRVIADAQLEWHVEFHFTREELSLRYTPTPRSSPRE